MPQFQPDARPLPPRRFAPIALLLATLAPAPSLAQGTDSLLAIVNTTVLPMDGRSPLTNHTIFVERDRIVAIGPTHQLDVPAGARRIDGTGRFVMPGLIDTQVHLRQADTSALTQYLRAGITTLRDMNGRPFLLEWRDRIRRGELRGPTLLVASPTIGNFSSTRDDIRLHAPSRRDETRSAASTLQATTGSRSTASSPRRDFAASWRRPAR